VENAVNIAPYADDAIHVSITSTTSSVYRSLHCIECGRKFLERDNNTFWRMGLGLQQPRQAHVDVSGNINAICPNCCQKYLVSVSVIVVLERPGIPLNTINQSIYFTPVLEKERRYTRCLECGKAFHVMHDRVSRIIDNTMPVELMDMTKLAPLEAICSFNRCRQQWSFVVS
jgi:hypothetical protein